MTPEEFGRFIRFFLAVCFIIMLTAPLVETFRKK